MAAFTVLLLSLLCVNLFPPTVGVQYTTTTRDRSACQRRVIAHIVRYHNCQPRRILSLGCAGYCPSKVYVSRFVDNEVDTYCQCCRESQKIFRRMRFLCFRPSVGSRMHPVILPVMLPTSCRCRPCSFLPDHIVPSERYLMPIIQDNKRSINVTNKYHEM